MFTADKLTFDMILIRSVLQVGSWVTSLIDTFLLESAFWAFSDVSYNIALFTQNVNHI